MKAFLTKAGLGVALAATTLSVATPAEAQRWRRDRGGDVATGAIIGGVVGLGLGAAIASSNRRDRYWDDRYYGGPRGYYRGDRGWRADRRWRNRNWNRGYYGRGYYDRGYYGGGYYGGGGYYAPGYGYGW